MNSHLGRYHEWIWQGLGGCVGAPKVRNVVTQVICPAARQLPGLKGLTAGNLILAPCMAVDVGRRSTFV